MNALTKAATACLREFCPDLTPSLRVTLELPGETFVAWSHATGDDLTAGIELLDAKERRRGLGGREWRLRQALREMMRRYQALGGTGPELVSTLLKQGAIEGVAERLPRSLELVDGRGALP